MNQNIPEGYDTFSLQKFDPRAMKQYNQLYKHVGPQSYLGRLASGDQSMFGEIEAPALRQFSELQGNIASRFSGMGLGGRHSSGFQNEMSSAGSNFAQQLQSQRQNLMRQALQDLFQYSNTLMSQKPYETGLVKEQQDPMLEAVMGLFKSVPGLLVNYATGGASGAAQGLMSGGNNGINMSGGGYSGGSGKYGLPSFGGF